MPSLRGEPRQRRAIAIAILVLALMKGVKYYFSEQNVCAEDRRERAQFVFPAMYVLADQYCVALLSMLWMDP